MIEGFDPDHEGHINDVPENDEEWSEAEAFGGNWQGVLADEIDPESLDDIDDDRLVINEPDPGVHIASCQDFETEINRLGRGIADDSLVVASGAIYMALGEDARTPRDIDLTVSASAYAHLRQQEGWQELEEGRLSNGSYDIGVKWAGTNYDDLRARSWQTASGIHVASLSDITDWKNWVRGDNKDLADVQNLRDRLLDPTKPPLPNEVITHEIDLARSCLPEQLRDDPNAQVAIELAANGLATIRALYGDDRIGRPQPIIGELERPEYGVVAIYHNGFGLPDDMRQLQRHMGNIGATDEERLEAMVADTYSDIAYGNGRRSDNPEGFDELRSANLLGAHATMKGYDAASAERHRQSILGTSFTEGTGEQAGRHHPDRVVRAVAGIDLQSLSEPGFVQSSMDLAVEDGMSARFSPARTIGQAAIEQGVRFASTEEGLRFVDENPDLKPANAPDGPSVREALAKRLRGNAGFVAPGGHVYPDGWTLEDTAQRAANSAALRDIAGRVMDGTTTAVEAYNEAKEYAR